MYVYLCCDVYWTCWIRGREGEGKEKGKEKGKERGRRRGRRGVETHESGMNIVIIKL